MTIYAELVELGEEQEEAGLNLVNTRLRLTHRLYIFTGTASFDWYRDDDDSWGEEVLYISMQNFPGRPLIPLDRWNRSDKAVIVAPASFHDKETIATDRLGIAVDRAYPTPPSDGLGGSDYGITANIRLRGNDTHLYRVSFQLTIAT